MKFLLSLILLFSFQSHADDKGVKYIATLDGKYSCSAFGMRTETGRVVGITARHCCEKVNEFIVVMDDEANRLYLSKVISKYQSHDLCAIDFPENGYTRKLGLPVYSGDIVEIIGYPLGSFLDTTGEVQKQLIQNDQDGIATYYMQIRANPGITHGSSGGPVLNMSGDVVGVLVVSDNKNMSGAVPITYLKDFLRELK